ncbi:MAG: hypothetical protein ABI317_09915 [Gaiellales bacterium]
MSSMTVRDARIVLGSLLALVALATPSLGENPTRWTIASVHAHGLLGPLVRAANGHWDVGVLRAPALAAGLVVALLLVFVPQLGRARGLIAIVATIGVAVALLVPAVALQAGLRDATAPWFHDNDSTYQIDIAGDLVRHGTNPYGHDYRSSGMERIYSRNGTRAPAAETNPALRHFPYLPGTVELATAWRLLPAPLDDIRFLVCLASLALLAAAWAFPGPPWVRLVLGAVLAVNPLTIRAAWFGTADALSLAPLVLGFGLVARRRLGWAAVALASAILIKQFAIVALPFLAIVAWQSCGREATRRAAAIGAAVLAVGILPFVVWNPSALVSDTVEFGAGAYRVVGYGLSNLLVRAGVVDRTGYYPFVWLALLIWLPLTVVLCLRLARQREHWAAALAAGVSWFLLFWIARVFQTSYLLYPIAGLAMSLAWRLGSAQSAISDAATQAIGSSNSEA